TVTVSSLGNWISSGAVSVGLNGSGRLNIDGGGVTSTGVNTIATGTGGIGYVMAKNGIWSITGSLSVGRDDGQANATVEVQDSGVVSATTEITLQKKNVTVKG